jgi:hypothetical protein
MVAAGGAVQQTYVHALRVVALSSLSFGILAIIACICCNDIGDKVSPASTIQLFNERGWCTDFSA